MLGKQFKNFFRWRLKKVCKCNELKKLYIKLDITNNYKTKYANDDIENINNTYNLIIFVYCLKWSMVKKNLFYSCPF